MRPPWLATRLRVAPPSARVYRVGDEVASCPAPSVHWLCRRWSFEYPRISHALSAAGLRDRQVAPVPHSSSQRLPLRNLGYPSSRCVRLGRRWSSESPRLSHPSAVPTDRTPSCPGFPPFGIADDSFNRLPRLANLPASAGGLVPDRSGSGLHPVLSWV